MSASVLIIEDGPDAREGIEASVRGVASVVETAPSGDAALMRLGMSDFGCIIIGSPVAVDVGGENTTVLEMFDRFAPSLASRIIVMTAAGAAPVIRRAARMGVFTIFLRPVDPVELRDEVRRCLSAESPARRMHGQDRDVAAALAGGGLAATW